MHYDVLPRLRCHTFTRRYQKLSALDERRAPMQTTN